MKIMGLHLLSELWLNLGIASVFLLGLNLLSKLVIKFNVLNFGISKHYSITDDTIMADRPKIPECYSDYPWFIDYINEAKSVFTNVGWAPFVYWRSNQHNGKYININVEGVRRSWTYDKDVAPDIIIHLYGGSLAWGWGARDDNTIASCLSRMLFKNGVLAQVINYAELGYVSTQVLIKFIRHIQESKTPNVIISIDGINDVFTTFQLKKCGLAQNEYRREREFNNSVPKLLTLKAQESKLMLLIRNIHSKFTAANTSEYNSLESKVYSDLAEQCIQTYFNNVQMLSAISRDNEIESLFFWQPSIFDKTTPSEDELYLSRKLEFVEPFYQKCHENLKDNLLPDSRRVNFYDISDVFKDDHQQRFIDPWHLSEDGCAMLANRIYSELANTIKDIL